ncbi:DUF6087 family protein [Kitasatospora sp. MAP5-34]|uniref:DUF6087 family protein n=1 Tax=Kitasatospora sp. MAP5-34 TaxID=3035102 RepID=UPI002474FA96|nr:DUF6087 family protein [Kitasatospora sp. MAP5-34]MDH6579479.1 hypothetical protein [Kitasatospora sp. MAP5-34]
MGEEFEEPLELWAARREALRRPVGERRVVRADGLRRAAHVDPAVPRVVEEWDGVQWVIVATAEDYAAGQRASHGIRDAHTRTPAGNGPGTGGSIPAAGTGRHRKP